MDFIKVYTHMTTSGSSFVSHDLLTCMDLQLDIFSMGFSHVASPIILDKSNIKIFAMVTIH